MNRSRVLRLLAQAESAHATSVTQTNELMISSESPEITTNNASHQDMPPKLGTIHEIDIDISEGKRENGQSEQLEFAENELEMLDKWDPMGEDFNSAKNTLTINPDQEPESVITGKMSEDCMMIGKYKVCEFYLKHRTCADGSYCSRLHIDPSARDKINNLQREYDMNTSRTRMVSSYLSPIELEPNDHALLLVTVTKIEYPTKFYFVAPYEQMNFAGFNKDDIDFYIGRVQNSSSLKTKLQKCHEQLARLFNHNYRVDNPDQPLCIGQMVACKLEDGRFCRATILDNRDRDDVECYYKLFLIDVGIEVNLPRKVIYEIRASCLSEPPMAVLGRLGLRTASNSRKWSDEAVSLFTSFATKSKYLFCKILSRHEQEDMFTVDLFQIGDLTTSVTELMLAKGLAERNML